MDFSYKELKQSLAQWKLPTCFKEQISLKQNKYGLMLQTKGLDYNYSQWFEFFFAPQEGCREIRNKQNLFMLQAAIVHLYTLSTKG